MLYKTAYLIPLLVWTVVRADIDNKIANASVECTETGFLPTFNVAYDATKVIGFEVHIGGVGNANSGGQCNKNITLITSTSRTIDVTMLNNGNEIPYLDTTTAACSGTFKNSDNNSTIDYETDVDIVVTQTIRNTIKRQKRFPLKLKCELRRDVNNLTSSSSWTIKSELSATTGVDDASDLFKLPINFDFYTDNSRSSALTGTFQVAMGENLYIRLKETNDNSLFKFTTEKCWATPSADPDDATQDIFFNNECGADETVTFVNKNDSTPHFDLNIEAFFFSVAPADAIFFHCDIYICKTDDRTTGNCIQNHDTDCPRSRRKRRAAPSSITGPVEVRTLTSNQHVVLPKNEIFHPKCSGNTVYDQEAETCVEENILKIKGVYLDIPWVEDLADTSSEAFKKFSLTKEYQIYALMKLTDKEDNIRGVKIVSARKSPTILDVLIAYKPTINSALAYDIFREAIHNPTPTSRESKIIVDILKVKREKVIEYVEISPRNVDNDTEKMTIIVLVIVLLFLIFIAGVVVLIIRRKQKVKETAAASSAPSSVKGADNPTFVNVH